MTTTTIRATIEDFLNKLGVAYDDVEVHDSGHLVGAKFVIKTEESGILIGTNGENLNALSHLLKRVVDRKLGTGAEHINFFIDINDYQSRKMAEIERAAQVFAERARMFKHDVEMAPASSYERMIVHGLFTEDPHIQTESSGVGPTRHIVIKYIVT